LNDSFHTDEDDDESDKMHIAKGSIKISEASSRVNTN